MSGQVLELQQIKLENTYRCANFCEFFGGVSRSPMVCRTFIQPNNPRSNKHIRWNEIRLFFLLSTNDKKPGRQISTDNMRSSQFWRWLLSLDFDSIHSHLNQVCINWYQMHKRWEPVESVGTSFSFGFHSFSINLKSSCLQFKQTMPNTIMIQNHHSDLERFSANPPDFRFKHAKIEIFVHNKGASTPWYTIDSIQLWDNHPCNTAFRMLKRTKYFKINLEVNKPSINLNCMYKYVLHDVECKTRPLPPITQPHDTHHTHHTHHTQQHVVSHMCVI